MGVKTQKTIFGVVALIALPIVLAVYIKDGWLDWYGTVKELLNEDEDNVPLGQYRDYYGGAPGGYSDERPDARTYTSPRYKDGPSASGESLI